MKRKFQFSKELRRELKDNGKAWDDLLFRACMEAKEKEVKASVFADALRKSGFRCGTGPARAAYKAVRDGKDQKGMVKAITAVKAKRKANKTNKAANTADNTANTANTDATSANTDATSANTDDNTLVGALENALQAAKSDNLEVAETWLRKAQAILATLGIAKIAAARRASLAAAKTA